MAPIRNPLLVGALLSHRSLPLSFFVPCSLEVTSGMLSRLFCVSLCEVPSQFCGGGHCPGPRISLLPALGLRREQARQGGREPEAAEEQDLRGCLTSRCWGGGGVLGTPRAPARGQHRPPGSGEPQMPGPGYAIRSHFLRASEPGVSERAQTDTRSPEVAHGSDAEAASVADCGVVSRRRGRSPRAARSRWQERAGLPFHRTGRCSGFAPTGTRCPLPP